MSADRRTRVLRLTAASAGVDLADVHEAARLEEDLGCDSLDVLEILMALEAEFDILSTPEDDAAVSTVGDLLALVERLAGAKP